MNSQQVVREIEPGRWVLEFVTSAGTTRGHTTFTTAENAVEVAKARNPDAEIEIRPLRP